MKKDKVREKEEAKAEFLIKAQSLIFGTVYIGRAHRPILCFSWIMLQSKLSRQSAPVGNCRSHKAEDSTWVLRVQLWQTLQVYLACSRLGEGHNLKYNEKLQHGSRISLMNTLTIEDMFVGLFKQVIKTV